MLIRFRVSNFLSFQDEVELSMIAGPSLNLPEHILKTDKSRIDLLRCAAVYGANASGKSNLIKAAEFARDFIRDGVKRNEKITLRPFKLDSECLKKPSKFEFEFHIAGKNYLYGFDLSTTKVNSEWLYELKKTVESMLFERITTEEGKVNIDIGYKPISKADLEFLKKFAEGTRDNQLFLLKCYEDENIHYFDEIFKWFDELEFIFPFSKYKNLVIEFARDSRTLKEIIHFLQEFDTGVCRFDTIPFNPDGIIPKEFIEKYEKLEIGEVAYVVSSRGEFFLIQNKNTDLKGTWQKIVFKHQVEGCESEIMFEMDEESDGTLRLIDLIPMLLSDNQTIFVDEIDRSIHPSLIYKFVELFLANKKNSQIIFTTHEDHLLDQNLLRRDEVWFVEKDKKGATSLYSLEEFAPRKDLDIQKGYLHGRFGAIPFLGDCNFLED